MRERGRLALETLWGVAVGDAFGAQFFLPQHGMAAVRDRRLPEPPWTWTDDTEMAASVHAVLSNHGHIHQDALARSFAEHYDFYRGYGPATGRLLRLVGEGQPWRRLAADLFDGQGSFGNGAAMRVAPVGAWLHGDLERVVEQARWSAEVTHTHPEAIAGAIAVAVATALACALRHSQAPTLPAVFIRTVLAHTPASKVADGLRRALALATARSRDLDEVAYTLGNGSRVTAQDTVPLVIWAAAHHLEDFTEAMWVTAGAGGDVDTTCAMVGGIVGSRVGVTGIDSMWLNACEPLPAWALR
jgi:ADP-ribosylglycohydrolase